MAGNQNSLNQAISICSKGCAHTDNQVGKTQYRPTLGAHIDTINEWVDYAFGLLTPYHGQSIMYVNDEMHVVQSIYTAGKIIQWNTFTSGFVYEGH